jgi:hypothetical protein
MGKQRALANARLTTQDQDLAGAAKDVGQQVIERLAFPRAADEAGLSDGNRPGRNTQESLVITIDLSGHTTFVHG